MLCLRSVVLWWWWWCWWWEAVQLLGSWQLAVCCAAKAVSLVAQRLKAESWSESGRPVGREAQDVLSGGCANTVRSVSADKTNGVVVLAQGFEHCMRYCYTAWPPAAWHVRSTTGPTCHPFQ